MKRHKVFNDTIGQTHAVERLTQSIYSGANGGEMLSPLFKQEAGGGKTHLMQRTIQAFAEEGFATLYFKSPEEFRERGANYDSLMQLITGPDKYAIAIDEAHMFHNRKTVQLEKVFAFLMKALDKGNEGRSIAIDGATVTSFNRKKGCFLLGTNFPHVLDKSGAFQSRCDALALDPYTTDELVEILQLMLGKANFVAASDKTLAQIARCGRGTARPMERIVGQIEMARSASGEKRRTINREDVLDALKLCKMYPKGLRTDEIKLMKLCKNRPMRDGVILATLSDMERETLAKSKGYLISQELGAQTTGGFQTTDFGVKYLEDSMNAGFAI